MDLLQYSLSSPYEIPYLKSQYIKLYFLSAKFNKFLILNHL